MRIWPILVTSLLAGCAAAPFNYTRYELPLIGSPGSYEWCLDTHEALNRSYADVYQFYDEAKQRQRLAFARELAFILANPFLAQALLLMGQTSDRTKLPQDIALKVKWVKQSQSRLNREMDIHDCWQCIDGLLQASGVAVCNE